MENLNTAYARARRNVPAYAIHGFKTRPFFGSDYSSERDGIGAAVFAIKTARGNLVTFADARARYETTHAIRDARRAELATAKAAVDSVLGKMWKGSTRLDESPELAAELAERRAEYKAAESAFAESERFADNARKAVAMARKAVAAVGADYGAGTWQGGQDGNPPAFAWALPPALRGTSRPWNGSRHMRAGDKGGQFFAYDSSDVLRNVRDAGDVTRLGHNGYYDNPDNESFNDGSGLILGVVAQLRARNGRAVFVPGWRMGDNGQGGFQVDLATRFVADSSSEADAGDAAADCARFADGMAESVAESEREYKTAWRAGQSWADAGERLAAIRADVLAILAERRAAAVAMGAGTFSALCDAIRARVDSLLAERAELVAERAELVAGDSEYSFYPDAAARAAFCEGADVLAFPV